MTRSLAEFLNHVLTACDRVSDYVGSVDHAGFMGSPMVQDAVVRQVEIIGEVGHQVLAAYGDDPLLDGVRPSLIAAYGMRNLVIHGYFGVDAGIVWETATRDLPALRLMVVDLLDRLPDEHTMPGGHGMRPGSGPKGDAEATATGEPDPGASGRE